MHKSFVPGTLLLGLITQMSIAAVAADLNIVQDGQSTAQIVVAPEAFQVNVLAPAVGNRPARTSLARRWEAQAATDLAKYVELMSGAKLPVAQTSESIVTALQSPGPVFVIGAEALKDAATKTALDKVTKKNPVWRADAIVVRRQGNRVYLAGSNEMSHYFAVTWLLQQWGCRWYLPGDFGECVPEKTTLSLGDLNFSYAPPFEVRQQWIAWAGSTLGAEEFRRRNYYMEGVPPGMGHNLGKFTRPLLAELGLKSVYNVPMGEPAIAEKIAAQLDKDYAAGKNISIAIEDGNYINDSPIDAALQAGIMDKYMLLPSQTDPMMVMYNNIARTLRERHPDSKALLGGMAYNNVTIPPQRSFVPEPSLVMWLAPIDIDPNHSMNDPRSPAKQEYGRMMERWAQLMNGKIVIYDYDQGQLVWRDLPNPSHHMFKEDVKRYRDAKILGFGTESRGAMGTVFTNLFFRGQLMWNPDVDVQSLLSEFYTKFYGPAAAPMGAYWTAIDTAWKDSLVTEHEYHIAPAIYTPATVAGLKARLAEAQQLVAPLKVKTNLTRNEQLYLDRMRFTELSFGIIEGYMGMVEAAATRNDFTLAVASGEKGLAVRQEMTAMNPTFTSTKTGERGSSWWPGEVEQMRGLKSLTDGTKGTFLLSTPLEWAFRRDPHDTGLPRGWAYTPADLTYWRAQGKTWTLETRKDYPNQWESLRTDLYMQAQGVRHPDGQSFTGFYWYQTPLQLTAEQSAGKVHLMFPGLFNNCWLYVNGNLVAVRGYKEPWWRTDYKFEWDVDISGHLKPGENLISLRGSNPHHFGGIFRRPFLYRPINTPVPAVAPVPPVAVPAQPAA